MTVPLSKVVQHLRRAVLPLGDSKMPDEKLLQLFVAGRDLAAFAVLVQRHGPMVWNVCRRVLGNHHDAEDAFQATFLVLVRKAASIVSRELLANWLYGVAHNTALKARAMSIKRRTKESQVQPPIQSCVSDQELGRDLQAVLDQELSRLPEKYRIPIVLCDLEGKTRREAARQLGCPEGTVAGRLVRARALLAKRLARHGLAVTGASLGTALMSNAASASLPSGLLSSTIQAASLFAVGAPTATALISAKALALTEGALKTMLLTKLTATSAVLLAATLLVVSAGTGGWIYQTQAAPTAAVVEDDNNRLTKRGAEKDQPDKKIPKAANALTDPRQLRILRWRITFDHKDGADYLKHLDAVGGFLAAPSAERGSYRVIRFLPRFIEDEMVRKEFAFAQREEEQIEETTFRFSNTSSGYDIQVIGQKVKPLNPKRVVAPLLEKDLPAAPGYIWVVAPNGPATAQSWGMGMNGPPEGWKGGAWTLRGILGSATKDSEGGLVIVLAFRPAECFAGYRMVAFDAQGKRYPFGVVSASAADGIKLERFALDPKELPAKNVETVGIEMLLPVTKAPEAEQPEDEQ